MGVNHFTDISDEEFKKRSLGYNSRTAAYWNRHNENNIGTPTTAKQNHAARDLPTDVDWRRNFPRVVTAVKDQGHCGSCWAFASTEMIESYVAIETGQLMVLSPQQLVSCSSNPNHCGGTGGCEGSIPELAFQYVKNSGMATEWTYPYASGTTSKDGKCRMDAHNKTSPRPAVTLDGFVKLPSNNQQAILEHLATKGPLAVNVQANTWRDYESGIYDGCSNLTNVDIDHVVQLVGYGYDKKLGSAYWLVRNSWNTGFGENGYIRLKRRDTPECGTDPTPQDGTGCTDGPKVQHVCGTCGLLFDASYPTGANVL